MPNLEETFDAEVLDLEPTIHLDGSDGSQPTRKGAVALVRGSLASLGGETHELRRRRLAAAGLFLAAVAATLFLWRLADLDHDFAWLILLLHGLRVVIGAGVAGLLLSRIELSRDRVNDFPVRIIGTGQAHTHQHVSAAPSLTQFGAGASARTAMQAARVGIEDFGYAAIYDSFTITLAILLEEIGLAPRGASGRLAAAGHFSRDGKLPLNTHGGLLSYGHCGVGGAMAHLVETHLQLTDRAGERQAGSPRLALLHGDGGVLSSHVSLILERAA